MNRLAQTLGQAGRRLAARETLIANAAVWLWLLVLLAMVGLPLLAIFGKALLREDGSFAGLTAFAEVLASPGLMQAASNSLSMAIASTAVVVPLAFGFAWALTRTRVAGRGLFRLFALSPLLAPSLLPGISIVYLFGNQGLLRGWTGGHSIYGFWGVLLGEAFYTFPYALLILSTALSSADARLYEAARTLGANPLRQFLTVTLPGARYGLVSAALVVFTLAVTDFGVPTVVGGNFNVLATEAFKQVIGQQNFARGAVVGLMLLLPALLASVIERAQSKRQQAAMTARAVQMVPGRNRTRDTLALGYLGLISFLLLGLSGVSVAASLIRYWPYNLSLTLAHYRFDDVGGGGWEAFGNSVAMAVATAVFGTILVVLGAYWTEKLKVARQARQWLRVQAMLPMAVPGLVLGLGYVFFFNAPSNPLNVLYGGLALMVVCNVAHYYSPAHLTAVTALKQLDGEFEAVAASLKVPFWITLRRVTLPVCLPALVDVARFFFVSAMTTVSALIFIASPEHPLAAVAIITMDGAGDTAAAAAMASMVVLASALVSALLAALEWRLAKRMSRWKKN